MEPADGISRPIRVLHVLEAIGGGTARHLIDLVRHVPDVQHEALTPRERLDGLSDDGAVDELRLAGALVHVMPMRRNPLDPTNFRALLAARRLIRDGDFDIVHGHSSVGGAVARLAASGTGAVRVYTPNGLARSQFAIATERLLRPLTDHFIAVSQSEADLAVRLRIVSRHRVSVIPNGIDPEPPTSDIDIRTCLGLDASTPLVGTISRLVPQKAPEQFVRSCLALAMVRRDVHFVLIGDGPLRSSVAALLQGHHDASRFHHLPDLRQPARIVAQLNVFCLTSIFEGGPYTPLEAMRAGVPVVVTDAVGNRDVVEDGSSGLIVPTNDPAATARALLTILGDRSKALRFAAAGQERFRRLFTAQAMGRSTRDMYIALVRRRSQAARV